MKIKSIILSTLLILSIHCQAKEQSIVLAGGCFWCMEKPFEQLEGVQSVVSGYSQGHKVNPSYQEVSQGTSGHIEVVQVKFNSDKISLNKILSVYWQQIDPTDSLGQFVDRGQQYTTGIFYSDETQKLEAENSKKILIDSKIFDKEVITPIQVLKNFYPAEDYHQDYYKKSSIKYWYYRNASGRDKFLEKTWTKAKQEIWLKNYKY